MYFLDQYLGRDRQKQGWGRQGEDRREQAGEDRGRIDKSRGGGKKNARVLEVWRGVMPV